MENYEQKYKEALIRARSMYESRDDAELAAYIFPELKESEDEKIRDWLITQLRNNYKGNYWATQAIAWLEKQKENIEKEYVFRPLAGTDITIAAEQAIRRANEGDRLVLAFNGAYIPVRKGCDANRIVDIYDTFIEKQKEQKPISSYDIVPYIDDKIAALQDMWREEKVAFDWDDMHEMIEDVARHFYHKEQKQTLDLPAGFYFIDKNGKKYYTDTLKCGNLKFIANQKEQKPVNDSASTMIPSCWSEEQKPVWSEEDEKMLKNVLFVLESYVSQSESASSPSLITTYPTYFKEIDWLKSLRPQSKDEIYKEKNEAFKLGKHQLAIAFMSYLDENRPEGKMSLSNGECEDIDKAFKENDWAKIMRYAEKYSPSWKPSEEQMKALHNFAYTNFFGDGDCDALRSLYEQLKKL